MLLHLCPRFFGPAETLLIDWQIEPFNLLLRGGPHLATRRPYPNKRFKVACRRKGNAAINGLLIETPQPIVDFRTRARWAVGAECVVEHTVTYRLIDRDFDFASDDPVLWYGFFEPPYTDRRTEFAKEYYPILSRPLMELLPERDRPNTKDVVAKNGIIVSRHQELEMPTLERGRLELHERMPKISDAFKIT